MGEAEGRKAVLDIDTLVHLFTERTLFDRLYLCFDKFLYMYKKTMFSLVQVPLLPLSRLWGASLSISEEPLL